MITGSKMDTRHEAGNDEFLVNRQKEKARKLFLKKLVTIDVNGVGNRGK